ncbi:hypothetical protein ACVIW2_000044 [Bradyrhizobium huanghuaihaiense]
MRVAGGVVTSAIKTVKFNDGTVLDMSYGPTAFTWIGSANNYNLVGSARLLTQMACMGRTNRPVNHEVGQAAKTRS